MKKITSFFSLITFILLSMTVVNGQVTYHLSDYGLHPNNEQNSSPIFADAIKQIKEKAPKDQQILIILEKGRYDFYQTVSSIREYYISNHDQNNPKSVGLPFEDMKNITFDGRGAELVFHGRMLPISLIGNTNCSLKNFSIDFETPHIGQLKILENDTITGSITFETAPWMEYTVRNGIFYNLGEGWEINPTSGIAFEEKSKHLVFNTSDIGLGTKDVTELSPGIIQSNKWKNPKLIPGTVIAARGWERPTPGIFIYHCNNTVLENIKIHYAEGMGLLAQMSENITLDRFSVCLRGKDDPRYFTTQADATHFSACKGKIISKNGLYENMMDDAINIHGTYLKVMKRIDNKTLVGKYMHGQTWGLEWGRPGDSVQFINSQTMEIIDRKNQIVSIKAIDQPSYHGAKEFEITFADPILSIINEDAKFGIENLEWTPEVEFSHNIIRNNRARGSLFSTPKKTIIENNTFDHTSGTAILLCGDCNGWFETGACSNIIIRKNHFINALTNQFQFTNAVISIYPEIPDLKNQKQYFHSNITIEDNVFETFDIPIVYAKSVNGLTFRNNKIRQNKNYPTFHWNKHRFFFQHVTNTDIRDNTFDNGFDVRKDIKEE